MENFIGTLNTQHTEFLLRLTVTMLCRKQHTDIALDAPKIMILMSKIKNVLAHWKVWRRKIGLSHEDSCQTLAKFVESLGVNHTIISKHLKVLETI